MNSLDRLLRDFEVQLQAQRVRDYEADARELSMMERSKVTCADRLAAQLGVALSVHGSTGDTWRGQLIGLGLGWIQLSTDTGDLIIRTQEIVWWEGGDNKSYVEAESVSRKLTIGSALRALAKGHREVIVIHNGSAGLTTEGHISAVGADYCELFATRAQASGKKVSFVRTIPFTSIAAVRVAAGS
ncbi:hypothetical protein [Rothia sp. CCM 9416]|uniref:hypothetical protein n=1 Tax=Rothia sp. CCM 9416 TaxID=3402655 RepID=UPI003ADB6612